MRRNLTLNRRFQKDPSIYSYSTSLVSQQAFMLHLQLYANYIKQTTSKIDDVELDTYNPNAILLHELFFENIGEGDSSKSTFIDNFFSNNFGSFNRWLTDFYRLCTEVRPAGWVAILYDSVTQKFKNVKIISHDCGIPVGCKIICLIDMYEHSFVLDYETNKKAYVENFIKCIKWDIIEKRINEIDLLRS